MKEMVYKPVRSLEVLHHDFYKCYEYLIVSYGIYLCAYIKVINGHRFFGLDFCDIDLRVHCGLTYSDYCSPIDRVNRNDYWLGWDYAHVGDYCGNEVLYPKEFRVGGKKWTTEEVLSDVKNAIEQIIKGD